MLISTLALTLAPVLQGPGPAQVILKPGDTLTRANDDYVVVGAPNSNVVAGSGGGWVAAASLRDPDTGENVSALVGQRPSQQGQGPGILFLPSDVTTDDVIFVHSPSMANGRLAFVGRIETAPFTGYDAVWVDEQLLFREEDPVPGIPNATWIHFDRVFATTTGSAVIEGFIRYDGQFWSREVLYDVATSTILVETGTHLPSNNGPLERLIDVEISPDGSHWAATAEYTPPHGQRREQVLFDGDVLRLGEDGLRVSENQPVPPEVEAAIGPTEWRQFSRVAVNDEGSVAFQAHRMTAGQHWQIVVRNGLPITDPSDPRRLIGMDERGVVTTTSDLHGVAEHSVERELLMDPAAGIDADGDGVADPGWDLVNSISDGTRPNRQAFTIVTTVVNRPNGVNEWMLLRVRDHRIDREGCTGLANSTGIPARMVASGSSDVADNDVALQALQMPQFSTGYFLVADAPGSVLNPGGSSGQLCLGGEIGRLVDQVFTSGPGGLGRAVLDLTAIPRPTGTVAATAGQTWHVQAWYRDAIGGVPTSNFTGAVSIGFD